MTHTQAHVHFAKLIFTKVSDAQCIHLGFFFTLPHDMYTSPHAPRQAQQRITCKPPHHLHSPHVNAHSRHCTYMSPNFQGPHNSSIYRTFAPEIPCSPPFTLHTRPLSAHVTSCTCPLTSKAPKTPLSTSRTPPKTPSSPPFTSHTHPLMSPHVHVPSLPGRHVSSCRVYQCLLDTTWTPNSPPFSSGWHPLTSPQCISDSFMHISTSTCSFSNIRSFPDVLCQRLICLWRLILEID